MMDRLIRLAASQLCWLLIVNSDPWCDLQTNVTYACTVNTTDCNQTDALALSEIEVLNVPDNSDVGLSDEIFTFSCNGASVTGEKQINTVYVQLASETGHKVCLSISTTKTVVPAGKLTITFLAEPFLKDTDNYVVQLVKIGLSKMPHYLHVETGDSLRGKWLTIHHLFFTVTPTKPLVRITGNESPNNLTIAYKNPYLRIYLSGYDDNISYSALLYQKGKKYENWCLPLQGRTTDVYQPPTKGKFYVKVFSKGCAEQDATEFVKSELFSFTRQDDFIVGSCVRHFNCSNWTNGTAFRMEMMHMKKTIRLIMLGLDLCQYPTDKLEFSLKLNNIVTEICKGTEVNLTTVYTNTLKDPKNIEVEFNNLVYGSYCIKIISRSQSCYANIVPQVTNYDQLIEPKIPDDPLDIPVNEKNENSALLIGIVVAISCLIGAAAAAAIVVLWRVCGRQNLVIINFNPIELHFHSFLENLTNMSADSRKTVFLLPCFDNELAKVLRNFLEPCFLIKVLEVKDTSAVEEFVCDGIASFARNITNSGCRMILYLNQTTVQLVSSCLSRNANSQPEVQDDTEEHTLFRACIKYFANYQVIQGQGKRTSNQLLAVSVLTEPYFSEVLVDAFLLHCVYNNLLNSLPDLFLALHDGAPRDDNWRNVLEAYWNTQPSYTALQDVLRSRTSQLQYDDIVTSV